jgi:hypothetical protein
MKELTEEQQKIIDIRYQQFEEIKKVMEDKKILTRGKLEEKYEAFSEKFPKTWISIIDETIMIGHLLRNIEAYEQMFRKSGGKSYKDRKFDADVEFGEKLAEEYLYPTTGRPDPMDYAKALSETKEKINTMETEPSKKLKLDFDKN